MYIIPNLRHSDSAEMMPGNRNKFRHAELVDPDKVVEMEMDKQNKLDDLKKQAQQQLDTIMVSLIFVPQGVEHILFLVICVPSC